MELQEALKRVKAGLEKLARGEDLQLEDALIAGVITCRGYAEWSETAGRLVLTTKGRRFVNAGKRHGHLASLL